MKNVIQPLKASGKRISSAAEEAAEKLYRSRSREGHDFSRAVKSTLIWPRFSA